MRHRRSYSNSLSASQCSGTFRPCPPPTEACVPSLPHHPLMSSPLMTTVVLGASRVPPFASLACLQTTMPLLRSRSHALMISILQPSRLGGKPLSRVWTRPLRSSKMAFPHFYLPTPRPEAASTTLLTTQTLTRPISDSHASPQAQLRKSPSQRSRREN